MEFLFNAFEGLGGTLSQRLVVTANGFVQSGAGPGMQAAGEHVHGLQVALAHPVDGQGFFNAVAYSRVFFFRQLSLKRLDQGSIHFAHHVLRGGFAHIRVFGIQVQHGQYAFKLAPYAVIDGDSVQLTAGHFTHILSGQRIGNFPVPAPVVQYQYNLPGVFYPAQAVISVGFEPAPGSFITTADDGVHRLFHFTGRRLCEIDQQSLARIVFLRRCRQR